MKKSEFVKQVLRESGVDMSKRDTVLIVDTVFRVMGQAIREERRFAWPRFGTFVLRERAARTGSANSTQGQSRLWVLC